MRVYKFRGRSFETGEYVYGDLIQGDNGVYIKRWEDGVEVEVDNDTIAQFSEGYDLNGEELYEGDVLEFDYNGIHYEYTVGLGCVGSRSPKTAAISPRRISKITRRKIGRANQKTKREVNCLL